MNAKKNDLISPKRLFPFCFVFSLYNYYITMQQHHVHRNQHDKVRDRGKKALACAPNRQKTKEKLKRGGGGGGGVQNAYTTKILMKYVRAVDYSADTVTIDTPKSF